MTEIQNIMYFELKQFFLPFLNSYIFLTVDMLTSKPV